MQDRLIWAMEFMAEHEGGCGGETVGQFNSRVRSFVERAVELGLPEELVEAMTDLVDVVEQVSEICPGGELLANALHAIPSRLAAHT